LGFDPRSLYVEPELPDVERSGVEAEGVDDVVMPRTEGEGVGRKGGNSGHEMASGERGSRDTGKQESAFHAISKLVLVNPRTRRSWSRRCTLVGWQRLKTSAGGSPSRSESSS